MPNTIQTLGVFLTLLPGFLCAYVAQRLAIRPKQTELDKIIEALLLSFIIYLCVGPFFGFAVPIGWHPVLIKGLQSYGITVEWKELVSLIAGAILFGILYAININHDWALTLLRTLRVTDRTARTDIWIDTFLGTSGTVQVGLTDGRIVIGWVHSYSDDSADASLFLEKAKWIDQSGKAVPINGLGILLLRNSGIQYVMFLDNETSEADTSRLA